ncbi:Hypothetical predicted protein [Podarcis lilfordi]|uniref:Uncharacterized protein n=1 Tax=Podarcis lilfordi TaxID=74358 RepID=A0AA35PL89_9SAUR|nr:Hypothetical predicted protein [Podarcis lilfordi]
MEDNLTRLRVIAKEEDEEMAEGEAAVEVVGHGLGKAPAKQQPSGAMGKPQMCRREAGQNKGGKAPTPVKEPSPKVYLVLAKSLERREDPQAKLAQDHLPPEGEKEMASLLMSRFLVSENGQVILARDVENFTIASPWE